MFNKKTFFVVLSIMITIFIVGCTQDTSEKTKDSDNETYKLRMGYVYQVDSPGDKIAKKFGDLAEEKSDGRIEAEYFEGGAVGDDDEVMNSVESGSLEVAQPGISGLVKYAKPYSIVYAPYLIRDKDHLKTVLDEWMPEINSEMKENDVRLIGYYPRGNRNLTSNKKVETPDDLNGFIVRTPERPMVMHMWETLGASPTPMDYGEVYTSLQQGVIDGQENPIGHIMDDSFYEVQDYLIMTEHVVDAVFYIMNDEWFSSLPEDLQAVVQEASDEAMNYGQELIEEEESEVLEEIEATGMEIVYPERELFMDKAEDGYDELVDMLDTPPEFMDFILEN